MAFVFKMAFMNAAEHRVQWTKAVILLH